MINSQEIKKGTCIRMDNAIWVCIDFQHVKPGKGNTVMRTKLKNVTDGRVLERTFQVGFKLEDVRIERRPYQFLYQEGDDYIFMNNETYDQAPIAKDLITGVAYMKENDIGCTFHYVPLHSAPAGLKFGRFNGEDVYTTKESDRLVRLPMYYNIEPEDLQKVIEKTKEFIERL